MWPTSWIVFASISRFPASVSQRDSLVTNIGYSIPPVREL